MGILKQGAVEHASGCDGEEGWTWDGTGPCTHINVFPQGVPPSHQLLCCLHNRHLPHKGGGGGGEREGTRPAGAKRVSTRWQTSRGRRGNGASSMCNLRSHPAMRQPAAGAETSNTARDTTHSIQTLPESYCDLLGYGLQGLQVHDVDHGTAQALEPWAILIMERSPYTYPVLQRATTQSRLWYCTVRLRHAEQYFHGEPANDFPENDELEFLLIRISSPCTE